ncbi:MAG: hypothetical protein WED34_00685 [Planctomycetales bacterium]
MPGRSRDEWSFRLKIIARPPFRQPLSRTQVHSGGMHLPFEGDRTLSIILSKAFLLAEDAKIDDPTITRQLRR